MSRFVVAAALTIVVFLSYIDPSYAAKKTSAQGRGSVDEGKSTATGALFISASDQVIHRVSLKKDPDGSAPKWSCYFGVGVSPESPEFYEDRHGALRRTNDWVTPEPGVHYLLLCFDDNQKIVHEAIVEYNPANPAAMLGNNGDLGQRIYEALSQVKARKPEIITSPPRSTRQLVGVQTWFWIDQSLWRSGDPPAAQVEGYTVTVHARPTLLRINPGDGSKEIPCTEATAKPWHEGERVSDCGHTYHRSSATQPGGAYTVTATLEYGEVSWEVRDPSGAVFDSGQLEPISGDTTFDLVVRDAQAVIR